LAGQPEIVYVTQVSAFGTLFSSFNRFLRHMFGYPRPQPTRPQRWLIFHFYLLLVIDFASPLETQ
jgi:hypothetical protein